MPDTIDYSFIGDREGGSKTEGYVPALSISNSGVTIATGFDLGCRNEADLNNLQLPKTLVDKLKPYLGKISQEAKKFLEKQPLTMTIAEANAIDKAIKKSQVDMLKSKYFAATENITKKDFFELPSQAQTVIASVSFQYGDLEKSAPNFWKTVTAQKWKETIDVLRDFGDVYKTRRNLEADKLQELIDDKAKTDFASTPDK